MLILRTPLDIAGIVRVEITVQLLKDRKLLVDLFVIKDQGFASDIILGREFLLNEKLTVVYKLHDAMSEEKCNVVAAFAQLLLAVDENGSFDLEQQLENCSIDFSHSVKKRLINVITEIERSNIVPIRNNYYRYVLKTTRFMRMRRDVSLMRSDWNCEKLRTTY